MNGSYERACTHTRVLHTHVSDRRRLKRSPTSIALAINAPSASSFCLSLQNARDSALSTCTSLVYPLLDPLFSLFREREWVLLFLASQRECFFFIVSDNSSDFRFRIFLTVILVSDSLQTRSVCPSFALCIMCKRYCRIT